MKLLILAAAILGGCSTVKFDRDPKTFKAPFNGEVFDNLEPFPDKSPWDLIKWQWQGSSNSVPWPEWVEVAALKPEVERSDEAVYTVINHATVLIQMNGLNILTDPHFGERASPVSFAGPKRVHQPGIAYGDLPPIDIVLISHNHYDHLDLGTLERLAADHKPVILAGLGTKSFLDAKGISGTQDMDWWDAYNKEVIKIHFVPAQHWSSRTPFDKREVLWGGFYLEGKEKVFFAGDTGYGKFFRTIRERLGAPDMALIPIGAYEPRWFMKFAHVNPEDSVRGFQDLQAKAALGIHFGTFKLTDEGREEPIKDLQKALEAAGVSSEDFQVPVFGQAYRNK